MKRIFFSLFVLILSTVCINGQDDTHSINRYNIEKGGHDYILMLNSTDIYNSKSILFAEKLADVLKSENISIENEDLSIPSITSIEVAQNKMRKIKAKYPTPPRLLISVGEPAWLIVKELLDGEWKGLPTMIYMGNGQMVSNISDAIYYMNGDDDPKVKYDKMKGKLLNAKDVISGYNATMIEYKCYIKPTIELIKSIIPNLNKIAFISDSRYISKVLRLEIEDIMSNDFPELKLECLSSEQMSTQNLIDTISSYDKNVGVIYHSWYIYTNQDQNLYGDNIQKVLYAFSKSPIFNIWDKGSNDVDFAGGVYIPLNQMVYKGVLMVKEILSGKSPKEIPIEIAGTPGTYLNYPHLLYNGISPDNMPHNAIYINMPPSFYEKYKVHIISISIILFLIIIIIITFLIVKVRKSEIINSHAKTVNDLNNRLSLIINAGNMETWSYDIEKKMIFFDTKQIGGYHFENKSDMHTLEEHVKLIHPDDLEVVTNIYNRIIDKKISKFISEYRLYSSDKKMYHWMESFAILKTDEISGRPISIVGASRVIDQRKMMEEEIREANFKAQESIRLESIFLANISHEIRTPLNAIVGFSKFITDDNCTLEERKKYISIVEKNSMSLLKLVNDILDFSVLEAGKPNFILENISLNKFIIEFIDTHHSLDIPEGVVIKYSIPDQEATILSDREKIIQVLNNLLSNAIKFTTKGSITIGYKLTQNNTVCFFVSDTGIGIEEEQLINIFVRFVKLDTFKPGTGFGLSICKSIVEGLKGKIWVNSEVGVGTTIYFTLPMINN